MKQRGSFWAVGVAVTHCAPTPLSLSRPSRVSLSRPSRVSLSRPSRVSLSRPSRLSLSRPSRLSLSRPSRVFLSRPSRLSLSLPSRLSLSRSSRLSLSRPSRVSLLALAQLSGSQLARGMCPFCVPGRLTIVNRADILVTFSQYPATSRWHHILASKWEELDYGNGVTGGIRRITPEDRKGWERNRLDDDDDDSFVA